MGVNLNGPEIMFIFAFMLISFMILLAFMLLGAVLGTIKNSVQSGTIAFFCGLILLLLWPHSFNLIFSEKAGNLSSIYSLEAEQIKVLSDFEKERIDFVKDKEDQVKATKEFTEKFLNGGTVENLEFDLIQLIANPKNNPVLIDIAKHISIKEDK
jgi:ABC-type multidrug transport system fused ATPase/permease subunit